jgi:thiosulfate/3-mercaptopyruvate sulfurtransferase
VLIEVGELADLLEVGTTMTILDVRWRLGGPPGLQEFERGHVPGARCVDLDADLAAPAGPGGRHPLPTAAEFGAAMRRLGVRSSAPVVVYDARDSMSAARCWWMLSYFGHLQIALLDGGLATWTEAGGAIESGPTSPPERSGDFEAVPGHLAVLDAHRAAALARSGVLLDARAGERYRGEVEPIDAVAGHIPGALSAPTIENLDADGRWRSPEDLRRRFARLGLQPTTAIGATGHAVGAAGTDPAVGAAGTDPAVATAGAGQAGAAGPAGAYCGSGVTAAHEVFALNLAGIDAALYVGSWSEWSRDASRPVATGPEPG